MEMGISSLKGRVRTLETSSRTERESEKRRRKKGEGSEAT
jgi:hypothetical protein